VEAGEDDSETFPLLARHRAAAGVQQQQQEPQQQQQAQLGAAPLELGLPDLPWLDDLVSGLEQQQVQQQQVQQQGPALEDVPAWLDAEVAYHEGDSDADISDVVEVRAVSGQPWDLELQVAGTSRPRRLAALQEAV
jgi:hypothetical protein